MMTNNWQRLNIWLQQEDRFDYEQHLQGCREAECAALPVLEYAQKAGMITCAMKMYPEMPVAEAYLHLLNKHQIAFTPPQMQAPHPPPMPVKTQKVTVKYEDGREEIHEIPVQDPNQQSCCGGGQVR
jgi:hypothetical protein